MLHLDHNSIFAGLRAVIHCSCPHTMPDTGTPAISHSLSSEEFGTMAKFLIRSDESPNGYIEQEGPLSRTRELSYVPWALTLDRRVVYAPAGQHRNRASRKGLLP